VSDSQATVATPMTPRQRLVAALFAPSPAGLYGILDAARDERIYPRLLAFAAEEEIVPLYQGAAATEMAAVAPYLVRLPTRTRLFAWLLAEGWGRDWGIFFRADAETEALRGHFRKLSNVRTEDGAVMLFRFYDPRVLSIFLPTCDAAQLAEIFGPVESFLMEGRGGRMLETFARDAGTLRHTRVPLF